MVLVGSITSPKVTLGLRPSGFATHLLILQTKSFVQALELSIFILTSYCKIILLELCQGALTLLTLFLSSVRPIFSIQKLDTTLVLFWCPCTETDLFIVYSELRFVLSLSCCVFQPVNGCSARCSLVQISFLTIKQLFPSPTEQNKQKIKGKQLKIMQNMQILLRSRPAFGCQPAFKG